MPLSLLFSLFLAQPGVVTLNPSDDLHAAAVAAKEGSVIRLNPGDYPLAQPLRVRKSNVVIEGIGTPSSTRLMTPKGFLGPLVLCAPEGRTPPTAPSLATGPGASYVLTEGEDYWLNLRDAVDVGGLAAFTVEFFFRPLGPASVHTRGIISSRNQLAAGLATDEAFSVAYVNGTVRAKLTTTGGAVSLASQALTVGQVYHVALTYDGSWLRLFVDGAPAMLAPLTGTVKQAAWEDVTIGPQSGRWPETGFGVWSTAGHLDGLRLSRKARYVEAFPKPAAKPQPDADALLTLNFDVIDGLLLRGTVGAAQPAYFVWMDGVSPTELAGVTLRNLGFYSGDCSGLHVHNCKSSRFENLESFYSQCGMKFWQNCYDSEFSSLKATAPAGRARYGIQFARAAFDLHVRRVETFGFTAGLVLSDCTGYFAHATCYQTQQTKFGMLGKGNLGGNGSLTLDYFTSSDEAEPRPDDLVAAFGFEGDSVLTMLTPSPQVARNPRPLVRLHGPLSVVMVGPLMRGHAGTPCAVQTISMVEPVKMVGGKRTGGLFPWCDVAGGVIP